MSAKSRLFVRVARPYVRRRLRRQFSDVRGLGLDDLRTLMTEAPFVLACNHVAWWDPLLLLHLEAQLGFDGYCLMDAANLAQMPFFGWVGALGIDRSTSRSAYRDLRAAQSLLDRPGRILAIFPHGDQRPAHLPLQFKSGVAVLSAGTRLPVVPLAIRYDYLQSPRPIVHLSAGTPLRFQEKTDTRTGFTRRLEQAVAAELQRIDGETTGLTNAARSLLGRSQSLTESDRFPLGAAALRLLTPGARR